MISRKTNRQQHLMVLAGSGLCLFLLCSLHCATAFQVPFQSPSSIAKTTISSPTLSTTTCLQLAKRRGKLGSIVDAGDAVTKSSRTVPKKRSKRLNKITTSGNKKSTSAASSSEGQISPLLQEWASASGDSGTAVAVEESEETTSSSTSDATTFQPFPKESKAAKRASKNSVKQAQDEERKELVAGILGQLEDVLNPSSDDSKKKTTDINDILKPIQQLLQLPNANSNLRQLLAGSTRYDYRLAWVGSDDSVCHVGTGLHNVPLARLQEVFLSLVGKSRLEVLEVIRIIGPFPNVRNTLEGSGQITQRNLEFGNNGASVSQLEVTYDSMIDGTGKQITAGMENNVRKFPLHIAFCSEQAIVAVVPTDETGKVRDNPLEDSGAHVLVFVQEEKLEEKLDALRVL